MYSSAPIFHVHPVTGEPGRCRAQIHGCPFGSYENHFENPDDARRFYEDFASKMVDPSESVEFHFITDEEESSFIEGDCGILARELNRKTGWPLVLVSSDESKELTEIQWDHMAVRAPDGRLIDAVGMTTEDEFKRSWGRKTELTEITPDQWGSIHPWKQQFDASPVKVANRILKAMESLDLWSKS